MVDVQRGSVIGLALLTLALSWLAASPSVAQTKGPKSAVPGIGDPTKLEGKVLSKVQLDDVRVLGILGFSLINEAQAKGEPIPLAQLQLSGLAVKAFNAKDHETAYRYATRFIHLRRGVELSEETEVASSIDFKLDRKLADRGEMVRILVDPVFTINRPLSGTYTARFTLNDVNGKKIGALTSVTLKELARRESGEATHNLKNGRYVVRCELFSPAGKSLSWCERDFLVHADVGPQVKRLRVKLDTIKNQDVERGPRQRVALESLEFLVGLFERARKEYVANANGSAHPIVTTLRKTELGRGVGDLFDVERDLKLADDLAEGLLSGLDVLTSLTGDLHLAYRSAVDKTLQPFRVFIPKGYDAAKKYPLIVALHGATGDENTYMDRYVVPGTQESLFRKLGQERGYLLVAPNGRGTFGGYTGDSEKDVLDVLDRVQQLYSVHPKQVFLTGHSMGGGGTWMIGFRHPDRFAALAPLAGRPQDIKAIGLPKAPNLPVLMFHGRKDTIATVQSARELVKVAQQELKHFKYVETDDDHFVIGVTSMPAIFDFFDAQRR